MFLQFWMVSYISKTMLPYWVCVSMRKYAHCQHSVGVPIHTARSRGHSSAHCSIQFSKNKKEIIHKECPAK